MLQFNYLSFSHSIECVQFTHCGLMDLSKYPPRLDIQINDEEMDQFILECYAVRRPLYVPSIVDTIGEVLSHSAVIVVCPQGNYIVEYMNDSIVHIKKCDTYVKSENFQYEGLPFVHDDPKSQSPCRPVTIRRFSSSMANFMAGKQFDTFSHNCHIARYLTMKKYGMTSNNPRKAKRNIFFQGFMDFFHRKRAPKIEDQARKKEENVDENSKEDEKDKKEAAAGKNSKKDENNKKEEEAGENSKKEEDKIEETKV